MDSFGLCVPTHGCGINVKRNEGYASTVSTRWLLAGQARHLLLSNSTFVSDPLVDTEPCICDGERDVSRQVSPLHRLIKNKQLRLFLGMRVCWEASVRDHSGFVKLTDYFSASRLRTLKYKNLINKRATFYALLSAIQLCEVEDSISSSQTKHL